MSRQNTSAHLHIHCVSLGGERLRTPIVRLISLFQCSFSLHFRVPTTLKTWKTHIRFFCPSFNRSTTMKTAFTGGGCQVEACPTVKIRVNKMLTVDVLVTPAVIQDKIEMGTHTHQNEASLVPTFRSHDETFHSKLATGCSTFDHVWRYFANFKFPFVPSTCTVFLQQRCWI